jgi:hypothetical protein
LINLSEFNVREIILKTFRFINSAVRNCCEDFYYLIMALSEEDGVAERLQESCVFLLHPVIENILYVGECDNPKLLDFETFKCFNTDDRIVYKPFASDFGPLNLACIHQFIEIVQEAIRERKGLKVVYCVASSQRALTNGLFLLGCYLILELGFTSESAWERFRSLDPLLEMYRDAQSSANVDFRLELIDCWRGLELAKSLGWLRSFDIKEYLHYNNLLEGDLHIIIPEKLIAFKGPLELDEDRIYQDVGSTR